mmetsp:Transcript_44213/g.80093  ORF Transcript_44213/g.80093 Transcript_44213/m.80093 type:complete len:225 (-) Transcript_44213:189-863(-)
MCLMALGCDGGGTSQMPLIPVSVKLCVAALPLRLGPRAKMSVGRLAGSTRPYDCHACSVKADRYRRCGERSSFPIMPGRLNTRRMGGWTATTLSRWRRLRPSLAVHPVTWSVAWPAQVPPGQLRTTESANSSLPATNTAEPWTSSCLRSAVHVCISSAASGQTNSRSPALSIGSTSLSSFGAVARGSLCRSCIRASLTESAFRRWQQNLGLCFPSVCDAAVRRA